LELLVVMIAVPFFVNILQFWVQDTFLKKDTAQEYANVNYSLLASNVGVGDTDFDAQLDVGVEDGLKGIAMQPLGTATKVFGV
jgi:hypothetical protein